MQARQRPPEPDPLRRPAGSEATSPGSRAGALLAVVLAAAAAGCASTSFNSTWRNPTAQTFHLSRGAKVLAVVMSDELPLRRGAEAYLAQALTRRGLEGIPSYTVIPDEMLGDAEQARAAAERAGVVGAVVMTPVGRERDLSASAPVYGVGYYDGFWGSYWGWGWGYVRSPGYVRTDTQVYVETLVFDLSQKESLIWAGRSKTTNPDAVDKLVNELVARVASALRKDELID